MTGGHRPEAGNSACWAGSGNWKSWPKAAKALAAAWKESAAGGAQAPRSDLNRRRPPEEAVHEFDLPWPGGDEDIIRRDLTAPIRGGNAGGGAVPLRDNLAEIDALRALSRLQDDLEQGHSSPRRTCPDAERAGASPRGPGSRGTGRGTPGFWSPPPCKKSGALARDEKRVAGNWSSWKPAGASCWSSGRERARGGGMSRSLRELSPGSTATGGSAAPQRPGAPAEEAGAQIQALTELRAERQACRFHERQERPRTGRS